MKNIKYYIPGLFTDVTLNMNLLTLMNEKPEYFNDNIFIDSVYGSFPCVWNGDSLNFGNFTNADVRSAVTNLNENGWGITYTFNNGFIDEDYSKDVAGNQILKTTSEFQSLRTNILLKSKCLQEKISDAYNDFNVIYDMRFSLASEIVDELKKNENMLFLIDSVEKMNQLVSNKIEPKNIILAVNDPIGNNDKNKIQMYDSYSLNNMKEDFDLFEPSSKQESISDYYGVAVKQSDFIDFKQIKKIFEENGVNKFWLIGNDSTPLFIVETYVNYLVKDEYKDEVRYLLLEPFFRK